MTQSARWIRLGLVEPLDLHASYAGLAAAQPRRAVPIVLWAQAKTYLCLGQSQGLAEIDPRTTLPVVRRPLGGGVVWGGGAQDGVGGIWAARLSAAGPARSEPAALLPRAEELGKIEIAPLERREIARAGLEPLAQNFGQARALLATRPCPPVRKNLAR